MKIKFIIICFCLFSYISRAGNDSCIDNKIFIESISRGECADSLNNIPEISIIKNKTTSFEKERKIAAKSSRRLDIFGDFWDMLSSLWSPVWGKYDESCVDMDGPFFLFDRRNNSIEHLRSQMNDLRIFISSTQLNRDMYQGIFQTAGTSTINNCNTKGEICVGANRAKASAFIYLVGLDGSRNALTLADRNGYRDRALGYLKDVEAPGLYNGWDFLSNIGLGPISNTLAAWTSWEKNIWRAKELQMLCQAWDMLKWCNNIDPDLNCDAGQLEEAGNRIKTYYVVPLHTRAQAAGGLYYAHNNYDLIIGSALASAAICFHDYGTYFFLIDTRPNRWANSAYYNIHNTMWRNGLFNSKMSKPGGQYGYAEGTHYYAFGFENMLPMFLARYNFCNTNEVVGYSSFVFDPDWNYVKNFWYDDDYRNLHLWYNNMLQPDGYHPTIDDSWHNKGFNGALSIMRNTDHGKSYNFIEGDISHQMGLGFGSNFSLREDYLVALTPPDKSHELSQSIQMPSGNIIMRSRTGEEKDKHYIHILNEKGTANNGGGHEHNDVGSFIICADNQTLAMDPPYYGDENASNINELHQHNSINLDENFTIGEEVNEYVLNDKDYFVTYGFRKKIKYLSAIDSYWERNYTMYREVPGFGTYYLIKDYIEPNDLLPTDYTYRFNLNGNGEQTTFNVLPNSNNMFEWIYPCHTNDITQWGLKAEILSTQNSNTTFTTRVDCKHGNEDGNLCYNIGNNVGNHARVTTSVNTSTPFYLYTYLYPKKCTTNGGIGQKTISRQNIRYVSILVRSESDSGLFNFHALKNQSIADTIINPIEINSSASLFSNAKEILLGYSTNREFKTGNCYTFTNFRKARIETGRELSYNDTTYILSTKYASAYYSLEGKYKYKGYVQTDTACDVKLYLADLDTNYAMAAVGISYNYNDTTHIMTLHAPVGNTNFTVELADPCLMSCFFPYTTDSIKNTFDFATGTKETLPHKLTITTPNGYLKIRNGSHMQICSGKWLRNKDSLIVDYRCPEDGDQGKGLVVCPDVVNRLNLTNPPPTISQLYPSTNDYTPSQITVNSYAALILDSGSYTRFGNNTKLTIKPYASFIIRKNAKLDIGDAKSCGHAEIICEPNSYVHFEDSADIQFWQMKDTNDVHLFYISLKPQATAAHAGIEPAMLTMLNNTDHIIDTSIAHAEPICEVAKIRAAYGVNNRDWGFGNFIKPKAWAYMANDTICPDECLYVNYDRMLNDVKRGITICQIDTIYNATNYNIIYTGCYSPAIPGGNMGMTASSGDGCDSIKNSKPISFCDLNAQIPGKWYRIFLSSYNDCDQLDTMKLYFIRMPRLLPDFTMADTGCTGIGSVTADENNDWNSTHFRDITKWHVHVIDSAAPNYLLQSVQYGGDWEYEKGAFPNTFTFPNFNWIGGFRYAVSHTIGTRGCKDTTMWDTIMIVPGAYIQASKPTVYAEPIAGATSVKLQGYIRAADSFTWTPNDWLNRTDTLSIISTPHESVSYILSAYKGSCVARDTISIRYNELSNIGTNDTLCYNNNIIALGNHYNAAMFLGWLQYYDVIDVNTELRNIIANLNNDDIYFDRYLKYFDSYMLAGRFKESQDTSCFAYYDLFKNSETYNWDMIFKDSLFVTYYNNYLPYIEGELLDKSIASTKINRFKTFIRDAGFKTIIEKHPIDSTKLRCFKYLFVNYESYLRGIYDESYYPMNVNWSKIEGQDTSSIDWENEYIAIVNPTKTTTYIQQALFPYGDISIDSKTIFIDTALSPLYYPSMQWDSSAYFTNATSPISSTSKYLWNFGDGSATSKDVNPFHTFPAFDSNYVVCLTATNKCGSYTHCDTVWIDSLHLGGSFKVAGFKQPERNEVFQNTTAINQQPIANNCQLSNYPNPFDQSTIIDYEIRQTFSKAELRITNVLGQEVYIQKLNRPMDKVQIDGSALHDGLYYYSLIVDGTVKLTKTMSVIR